VRRRSEKKKAKYGNRPSRGGRPGSSKKHGRRDSRREKSNRGGGGSRNSPKTFLGKVQKNPRGFAFLLPQGVDMPDAFVPNQEAAALMSDDVVEFSLVHRGGRPSAQIHRIVKRGQKEIVGTLQRIDEELFLVSPEGEPYRVAGGAPPPGTWAIARIKHYPGERGPGVVTIKEELGSELTPKHDLRIAISRFNLESEFSSDVVLDSHRAFDRARHEMETSTRRKDHRHLPLVTIDGPDAKDFDDAILVETPAKGPAFILYVAIADVSFFVTENSALDDAARSRGTSVYFPGVCIPMLPETLSNDLCSLRPQTDKLALTAEIHYDREGEVTDTFFYESLIKTARRLTYDEVQRFFDGDKESLTDVREPLQAAYKLYRKLLVKRKQRGVLDFELPESKIEVDAQGKPLRVHKAERYDSHRLIEEFMIAANAAVARALTEHNVESLHRVHDKPDPKTVDEVNALMRNLGISKRIKEPSAAVLSELLSSTADLKGAKTLHQAILRLQKQARYEPDARGHFGLALSHYTHFTSPIRRYPDLIVHRTLKKLIYRQKGSDNRVEEGHFERLGEETSERERRAMEAERFVVKRKQCWFMKDRLGEEFMGTISGLIAKGIFIEIPDLAVEGFLPAENLDGYYAFDEARVCFRKRPGHTTLNLGDEISFHVQAVSVEDGEITFSQRRDE